jgi:hypothetical protein
MNELDQLAISRILGSTVHPIARPNFSGFSVVKTVGVMLANRPRVTPPQAPDRSRDAAITKAFRETHQGFSVDRVLADPKHTSRFVKRCLELGANAPQVLICRRLLRLRKEGGFVKATKEDNRDLNPFLIPAELAFAQLTYRFDASYDDLLADPIIGSTFDELVAKIGRIRDTVSYRLAALHLRKNVRSRSKIEAEKLAKFDMSKVEDYWRSPGLLSKVQLDTVPETEGIFSLREPARYLYLSRYPDLRSGIGLFQDEGVLAAVGNRFWTPSADRISVDFLKKDDLRGVNLRLFELKALEKHHPLLNMLPKAA